MLLNRPKNIDVARMVAEEYINTNYTIKGNLSFENVNGICIVNCDGDVRVTNGTIPKLTEGFVWGEIKGDFDCSWCTELKSLEGAPEKVSTDFYCSYCKSLETLKGAPKEVGGAFGCLRCDNISSLEGAPEQVGGNFYCTNCKNLRTLEGAPEKVRKDFNCRWCDKLESLEGAPKKAKRIDCDERLK